MTRLEQLKTLSQLEQKRVNINNLINDLNSFYLESATISCELVSRDFSQLYNNETIPVDHSRLIDFLKQESEITTSKISEIIQSMSRSLL